MGMNEFKMKNKKCHICSSQNFENRKIEYIYRRKEKYLIIRDVPCEVCMHCGERFYSAKTLLDIEKRFRAVYENNEAPRQTLQIPVEAYKLEKKVCLRKTDRMLLKKILSFKTT